MAAPDEITMADLSGVWTLNKDLSTRKEMDDMLAAQGVSYVSRNIIYYASITLNLKNYLDSEEVEHIDIATTLTGGIQASPEDRVLNGKVRGPIENKIFGPVGGQSGRITEDDLKAKHADKGNIRQGWLEESYSHKGGIILSESWSWTEDSGKDWCATQTWGFQEVEGERRHVRKVYFEHHKGKTEPDQAIKATMVYDYVGPLPKTD